MTSAPVVMIGWDAADWRLVQALASAGELPALASLQRAGVHGPLRSVAETYAGGVWPTFYTGKGPEWHGIYHSKLWRRERMRCETVDPAWLPERPFWERWGRGSGIRVCAIDVPMTLGRPAEIDGIQIAGWATHDLVSRGTAPPGVWRELRRSFGRPILEPEHFGPQTPAALLRLRSNLVSGTRQQGELCASLLRRERWDLFLAVLGAPHRAGHYLFDLSQLGGEAVAALAPEDRLRLESGLADVYRACDAALARVLEAAPAGARVLVFAVHGMGKNRGWSDLCPALIDRMQRGGANDAPKHGLLYRVKTALPPRLAEDAVSLLPLAVRQRLVSVWSARMFDWSKTAYFPLPMDQAGYLRVNLRGREPRGIVAPGAEYDALCDRLADELRSWCDLASGQPIVDDVQRAWRDTSPEATQRDGLPDLVVTWSDASATESPGVGSPRFGDVRLPARGRLPSGRSGNHRNEGWFVAAGPALGAARADGHIVDLAPTVHAWLGLDAPPDLRGRELFAADAPRQFGQ